MKQFVYKWVIKLLEEEMLWHRGVSCTTQTGLCSDVKVNVLYPWWGKERSSQETNLYRQFSYGYNSLGTSHQVASTFIL